MPLMAFEPAEGAEAAPDIVRRALAILDEEVRAWVASAAPADETSAPKSPVPPEGDHGR